jgi:hypothetical protein
MRVASRGPATRTPAPSWMSPTHGWTLPLAAMLAAVLASACSECRNDLDCARQEGKAGFLCVEGTCREGDADPEPSSTCEDDGDCAEDGRCLDGVCVITPTCLQLSANFVAVRSDTGAAGEVQAVTDGCEVTLSVAFPSDGVELTAGRIADDGTWEDPVGFSGGRWSFVDRVGTVVGVFGTTIRFGTTDVACTEDGDCAAQVRDSCRTPCEGGSGCAAGGCAADGFCRAQGRGHCQ